MTIQGISPKFIIVRQFGAKTETLINIDQITEVRAVANGTFIGFSGNADAKGQPNGITANEDYETVKRILSHYIII